MKPSRGFAIACVACLALLVMSSVQAGTVYWTGLTSTAWTDVSNWDQGTAPSTGDTVILNQGSPYTPVVSTSGNPTTGQVYVSIRGGLNVFAGGDLSMTDLITGVWGNSGGTIVTGGLLTMSGLLNLGAAGYDGKIDISGGIVQSAGLSINATGGAGMNISGNGKYITSISKLNDVNYWVNNNIIKANNGAAGWSINIDTTTDPSKVILTAVPEPATIALAAIGAVAVALRRMRKR
jgi:hypothetical protein